MIRHLAGLAEIVDDVPTALAFYRDTLGLAVKDQMGDDYAVLHVPGILHFGVWSRAAAAEATYGSRDAVELIPLGFTIEFEVDNVEADAPLLAKNGSTIVQQPKMELWGQKSCRAATAGGSLLGFAESPWARHLIRPVQATGEDA